MEPNKNYFRVVGSVWYLVSGGISIWVLGYRIEANRIGLAGSRDRARCLLTLERHSGNWGTEVDVTASKAPSPSPSPSPSRSERAPNEVENPKWSNRRPDDRISHFWRGFGLQEGAKLSLILGATNQSHKSKLEPETQRQHDGIMTLIEPGQVLGLSKGPLPVQFQLLWCTRRKCNYV